jgi:hypothetical protein
MATPPARPPATTAPADPWWYEDPEAFEGFMAKFKAHPNVADLFDVPVSTAPAPNKDVGEHATLTDLLGAVLRDGIVARANGTPAANGTMPPGLAAPGLPASTAANEQPLTWQEKLWGRQTPAP